MPDYLFTCREGFERDLVDELTRAGKSAAPRMVAPALVITHAAPPLREGVIDLAFARQCFAISATVNAPRSPELDPRVTAAIHTAVPIASRTLPWALHVWVPDSTAGNRLSRNAETLHRAIELRAPTIDSRWADLRLASAHAARSANGLLVQVCVSEPATAIVGVGPAAMALSMHPGGRARMRVSQDAPSRAAMKLEEALDWIGHGPESGERCVDLGAAPGGWSFVVMERGARVVAVDPGAMAPALMPRRALEHIRGSAFDYEPDEPVDWLLCDMVWRPLEVAALLAKWARRRWAGFVVANIKMPMRGKVEFLIRIRAVLEDGGWKSVRFRQLYHDREEVTLAAHL